MCECGTKIIAHLSNLRSGHTRSCGCTSSFGEEKIAKLLTENNINFIKEKTYEDLISCNSNNRLRFDFFVSNKYLIEFDGIQHFSYAGTAWNNEENFEKTRKHDLMKNKYCFDNNIPLIRMPYAHLENLKLEDLLLKTSDFILTSENEDRYYSFKIRDLIKKGEL